MFSRSDISPRVIPQWMDDLYYQLKYASYQVNIGQGLKRFWQLGSRRENHKHDLKIFSDPDRNHRLKIFLASFNDQGIMYNFVSQMK